MFDDHAPIREQLRVLAHDEDKHLRPHLGLPALGIGLAGATLMDLLAAQRIHLQQGCVHISDLYNRRPAADPVTDHVLQKITALRRPPPLTALLRETGPDLYDRTLAALIVTGIVTQNRRRLRTHHDLVHPGTTVRIRAKITYRLRGQQYEPNITTDALCALVLALSLHDSLLLAIPTREASHLLSMVTDTIRSTAVGSPLAAIPDIAEAVHHAVGDFATAAF